MSYDTEKKRSGRIPFTFVEAKLDYCTRTFGVGPCLATGEPCYNTRSSCKSVPAYDITKKTYRFCTPVAFPPQGLNPVIPCLKSVTFTPAKIDPGKGLGLRAAVSITLDDLLHSDVGVDPYVSSRSYDPMTRGTYFGRMRSRNPFYNGRELTVFSGYLTEDFEYDPDNFEKRTYFFETWAGPGSGDTVTWTGKDVLKLADDDRAVAPAPSRGKLLVAINDTATSATLAPSGIGVEYPASGVIRMSGELMTFTRSGDNLTLVRHQYNTAASQHSIDETVQLCLVYTGLSVQNIVYDLLTVYAKVDPVFINKPAWDAEQTAYLPRLYSAVITAPTGVNKLVAELCEQVGVMFGWDEVESLIKFQSVRPNGDDDPVHVLTPDYHLVEKSVNVKDLSDQRVNEVWVYYGVLNPTKDLSEETNYKKIDITSNLEDQGETESNDIRIKKIFSRWITEFNTVAAQDLGRKIVDRYHHAPREGSFSVDAKDGGIKLMDFVQLTDRHVQGDDGSLVPITMQVIERKEAIQGTMWNFVAREFAFSLETNTNHQITINADVIEGINIRTIHDTLYDEAVSGTVVILLVKAGVLVTGNTPEDYAITTGVFATGVILKIIIESTAIVAGRGGKGADAWWYKDHAGGTPPVGWVDGAGYAQNGGTGGDGILFEFPTIVDNQGIIGGGGGGGGNGCSLIAGDHNTTDQSGAGGGGAPLGQGGARGFQHEWAGGVEYYFADDSTAGETGGYEVGGNGGVPWYGDDGIPYLSTTPPGLHYTAPGGKGGDIGATGSIGGKSEVDVYDPSPEHVPGNGGAPGRAVVGNSYVTWVNTGTILGAIV